MREKGEGDMGLRYEEDRGCTDLGAGGVPVVSARVHSKVAGMKEREADRKNKRHIRNMYVLVSWYSREYAFELHVHVHVDASSLVSRKWTTPPHQYPRLTLTTV